MEEIIHFIKTNNIEVKRISTKRICLRGFVQMVFIYDKGFGVISEKHINGLYFTNDWEVVLKTEFPIAYIKYKREEDIDSLF
tara:strand:- start:201 stop:446 length:246 start_codon:yes stop_codon:yes gene_type:complete